MPCTNSSTRSLWSQVRATHKNVYPPPCCHSYREGFTKVIAHMQWTERAFLGRYERLSDLQKAFPQPCQTFTDGDKQFLPRLLVSLLDNRDLHQRLHRITTRAMTMDPVMTVTQAMMTYSRLCETSKTSLVCAMLPKQGHCSLETSVPFWEVSLTERTRHSGAHCRCRRKSATTTRRRRG